MKISPLLLTIRAVSAEFARRIYIPILWVAGGVLVVLHLLGAWLISLSSWWWLLEAVFIFASLVTVILAVVVIVAVKVLRPNYSVRQKRMIYSFIDSLQGASGALQTPKFILMFRLAKDAIFPNKNSFVNEVTSNAGSLKTDFQKIVDSFS